MGNYQKLEVWQRSHRFSCRVEAATRGLRRGHAELGDQLRRASLSIPTNLAEGSTRGRDGDYARFVGIAIGSAAETESLLLYARDTGAMGQETVAELLEELTRIRQMLWKLKAALEPQKARP